MADRVEVLRDAIMKDRMGDLTPTWDDVIVLLCRLDEAREKAAEEAFQAIADMGRDGDVSPFGMGVRAAHNALRRVFG